MLARFSVYDTFPPGATVGEEGVAAIENPGEIAEVVRIGAERKMRKIAKAAGVRFRSVKLSNPF